MTRRETVYVESAKGEPMSMDSVGKPDDVVAVRAFVAAAIADGWDHSPTYASEAESRACRLSRDGFVIQAISRDAVPADDARVWLRGAKCSASIYAWGADGMSVRISSWLYPGFGWFTAACQHCNVCGADGVPTFRFSFAGRACARCIPAAKAESEKPGWDN